MGLGQRAFDPHAATRKRGRDRVERGLLPGARDVEAAPGGEQRQIGEARRRIGEEVF